MPEESSSRRAASCAVTGLRSPESPHPEDLWPPAQVPAGNRDVVTAAAPHTHVTVYFAPLRQKRSSRIKVDGDLLKITSDGWHLMQRKTSA